MDAPAARHRKHVAGRRPPPPTCTSRSRRGPSRASTRSRPRRAAHAWTSPRACREALARAVDRADGRHRGGRGARSKAALRRVRVRLRRAPHRGSSTPGGAPHRASPAPVGDGGFIVVRGRAAAVAWRDGARIGVIVMSASRRVRDPGRVADGYAVLADRWLRTPLPASAWARVLTQIRPNGTVSKATALQAFSVVYGPLPGVPRPPGVRTEVPSGTQAALWTLSYFRRLTARQQRIVERRLGVRVAGGWRARGVLRRPRLQARHCDPIARRCVRARLRDAATAHAWAEGHRRRDEHRRQGSEESQGRCARRLHAVQRTGGLGFRRADDLPGARHAGRAGEDLGVHGAAGRPRGVPLLPGRHPGASWSRPAAWITEGTADWAALSVDPVPFPIGGGNLKTYIGEPYKPLFQRAYDAVGFWGHVRRRAAGPVQADGDHPERGQQ